jgi:hypothetical protein
MTELEHWLLRLSKLRVMHQDVQVASEHAAQKLFQTQDDSWGASAKCAQSVQYVVRGKRVTKQQAYDHAAASGVVCVVHELTGGGCGTSVSTHDFQLCQCKHIQYTLFMSSLMVHCFIQCVIKIILSLYPFLKRRATQVIRNLNVINKIKLHVFMQIMTWMFRILRLCLCITYASHLKLTCGSIK